MKNNNTIITISIFVGVFFAIALIIGGVYATAVNRPPLVYATIPISTQDFLKELTRKNVDMGVVISDNGPFDWDNDEDYGIQSGWTKEEDENFIVYYHKDNKALWQGRAKNILAEANSTIPDLADLMGRYYFPEDVNGRKLAIYLASNENEYEQTIQSLTSPSASAAGSIGMYCWSLGPYGSQAKGIVIHPSCFETQYSPNGYQQTLRHEMNHYVFFSSLNYEKEISHYLWISEGLARYFQTDNHPILSSADTIQYIDQKCQLNGEFPKSQFAAYWAGESFYVFLEESYGVNFVKKFISSAYQYNTDSTFIINKMKQAEVHNHWVQSLTNN